jgi:hypothetical protein
MKKVSHGFLWLWSVFHRLRGRGAAVSADRDSVAASAALGANPKQALPRLRRKSSEFRDVLSSMWAKTLTRNSNLKAEISDSQI